MAPAPTCMASRVTAQLWVVPGALMTLGLGAGENHKQDQHALGELDFTAPLN